MAQSSIASVNCAVITSGTSTLIRVIGSGPTFVLSASAPRGLPGRRREATLRTVDAVEKEVRFTTQWGGQTRYVFIPNPYVSDEAGRRVTRDEALEYVRENLDRYRAEARAQHGEDSVEKIRIIMRNDPPGDDR